MNNDSTILSIEKLLVFLILMVVNEMEFGEIMEITICLATVLSYIPLL